MVLRRSLSLHPTAFPVEFLTLVLTSFWPQIISESENYIQSSHLMGIWVSNLQDANPSQPLGPTKLELGFDPWSSGWRREGSGKGPSIPPTLSRPCLRWTVHGWKAACKWWYSCLQGVGGVVWDRINGAHLHLIMGTCARSECLKIITILA